MDISPIELRYYQTGGGNCPFRDWLYSLDITAQVIIDARLVRIRRGLFGDNKYLGGGVYEIRLDTGPGYRLYYGKDGRTVVILISGGTKKGQDKDIEDAKWNWADYSRRAL